MFHQRRESPSIRSPVSVVKRCEYLLCSSVLLMSSREFLLVGFYPYRHVARHAIFPRPKPKEYQLHIVQPRRSNDAIDKGEIEHSFLRLQKLPIHRHNKGIQVHLDDLGPDRVHVFQVACARISGLTREHEKRFSIHNQLCHRAVLRQMRDGPILLVACGL